MCHLRHYKTEINVILEVTTPGSYFLNMESITRKNGNFKLRTSDQSILKIELSYFEATAANQHVPVRLCRPVEDQLKVIIFLDDLDKHMTSPIAVKIMKRQAMGPK